jgi:pilus assembly protein Flp/PilA
VNNLVLRATCFAQSLAFVVKDRRGVTAMEYGLIASLVAVALVIAVGSLTTGLKSAFASIGTKLTIGAL